MHPIAFEFGSLTIYWYGVLVGLGCLAGLWTASRRGLLDRFSPEKVYDVGLWVLVGTIVGARALHVISYWDQEFAGRPWVNILNLRQGGLVFYGGFLGAAAGVLLFCWIKKEPLWRIADMLAPSTALGSVFGRIGCLMTGCCFGSSCTLPWAIHFPTDHATRGAPVHPSQIYDSLTNLAVYGVLEWCYRRKRFDGQVFAGWLLIYPIARSFTEMFRGDYAPSERFIGGMTPAQLLSVAIFAAGAILYWKLPRKLGGRPAVGLPPGPDGDA